MSAPLPKFTQLYVTKESIRSYKAFKELIDLYNLEIVYEEPEYYILDGTTQDLHDFKKYWRDI